MTSRVTFGDFSRAAHLSVKTLRHYHEVGLLEPSEVDPDSGYRYYSEDQIPLAQVIRRLRSLQMPVADVKAVLTASDSEVRNRLIVEHLTRLEAELADTAAVVALQMATPVPDQSHSAPGLALAWQPPATCCEGSPREARTPPAPPNLLNQHPGAICPRRTLSLMWVLEPSDGSPQAHMAISIES
jgi:DNA-binding transcriptional MerR regulator